MQTNQANAPATRKVDWNFEIMRLLPGNQNG